MTSKEELREQWKTLNNLVETTPSALQARGYQFEKLIFSLLQFEGLNPLPPYRIRSEQIDGMFEMDGRYFLLELKWEKDPSSASSLYAFRAKEDGKLVGTIGLFISVNGFSKEASVALSYGKEINILLVDGEDLNLVFDDKNSFREMLQVKLRQAAQHGTLRYVYKRYLQEKGF